MLVILFAKINITIKNKTLKIKFFSLFFLHSKKIKPRDAISFKTLCPSVGLDKSKNLPPFNMDSIGLSNPAKLERAIETSKYKNMRNNYGVFQ